MRADWLDTAKVGDDVIWLRPSGTSIAVKVERLSDAYVVAGGTGFRRYDGKSRCWWGVERLLPATA